MYTQDVKDKAIEMYSKGLSSIKIAEILGVTDRSVRYWVKDKVDVLKRENITVEQTYLTLKDGVVLLFSDAHFNISGEMSTAAKALLKVAKKLNPDIVIDLGDGTDFATISKHDPNGWEDRQSVADEIKTYNAFLDELRSNSKKARHIMLVSNHNIRFNKFLASHAPQFRGVKGFSFEEQFENWEHTVSAWINDDTILLHEWATSRNAALANVTKAGCNICTGHTHVLNIQPLSNFMGDYWGIQTGTLAEVKNNPLFRYTKGTALNWMQGFVVLTYRDGKLQYPEVVYVNKNNEAIFRGEVV